ncbi:hypothetical protein K431DRAFT_216522 [Polychaeton citri CBS 116435]|uniref:non-specific serine/threonine protein kinase n=1 Tax=Polychaeton citri CBS 116435 TaxID=1314669 RepID=A0A9P4UQU6_9PEZI|nr:hypothetical protein K431DRAFT_216522 [Polychaeton citri CBS 116435]
MLAPPAITALRHEAKVATERVNMERTASQDFRDERDDLKRAAEQSLNAILELDLEGKVRWISPSWQDLSGTPGSSMVGKPMSEIVLDNPDIFAECVEWMRKDDSKSKIIRFSIKATPVPTNEELLSPEDKTPVDPKGLSEWPSGSRNEGLKDPLHSEDSDDAEILDLEAQGIMVYDRATGEESHTMWMVKPATSREITIDLPEVIVSSLGIGAEMLARYLTELAEVGIQDPANHPPPLPVLCRICERQITPWWFEKHTELCSQEHRAEMEVQMSQESLNEQRSALVKVLDALEAQSRSSRAIVTTPDSTISAPVPKAEYKGLLIGPPSSAVSSASTSGRASPASQPARSRDSSASGYGHQRARSFAVRRPLARIVELVLDLCDTAMEISTPAIKDTRAQAGGELRTQSPQSESRIQQVLQWQSPSQSSLENEQGLALLSDDTFHLTKTKVDAVFRHRQILEYAERIRVEYDVLVQECIEAALEKARRIAAGELSDSSSTDDSTQSARSARHSIILETHLEESADELPDPMEPFPTDETLSAYSFSRSPGPSAMTIALRDRSLSRHNSSAGSSRASSPRGAATPKSYGAPSEHFHLSKRGSIAFESDTGAESDSGSVKSSITNRSTSHRRGISPSAESSLSRVASSRERKRKSLVLPSLAAQQGRHESPARGPPPPPSPLRIAKPRIPSGTNSDIAASPITSPILTHSEFSSPVIRAQFPAQSHHHHRRQSSAALSEALAGRPASPRLTAATPQPRAVQQSIRDFEIIKPISKGAFGSVYLSKKKSTGDYYAIKVLKKADMVAKNQVTNVKAERAIMMWQGESDFVAKLYWTFASKDYLYLVMEYLNGGDCASLVKVLGALPEDWTKKYIAEVVVGVQHLHARQIVHRDLKPDNLLIDQKGHLKLTDFGLSRMGLIGRQKRVLNAKQGETQAPDLLKQGPFRRAPSVGSSRSTSFDFQGTHPSPGHTPSLTPAVSDLGQPSYFSLNRESSRDASRRTSGHRSDSNESELSSMFRRFSIADGKTPIEEETGSEEGNHSPDPYALQPIKSNVSQVHRAETPPSHTSTMPPPMMALFDPEDSNRRFVGTPDYLAPETINGAGQDEMSDWWSLGCILFECLYGRPPFNADTPEEVFQNILARRIQWPEDEDEDCASPEAKDLMNRLMCLDPKERLGSNKDEEYENGGEEIKAHPWFIDINWDTLREDEASFIPMNENPEDTEYFDARGASMQNFAAEFLDQESSPANTPGADYPDRPHDALSRVRSQVNSIKRNLMPLHIPPHVRDGRSRRLSEPVAADDFGSFQFKNLPVLEKANKDVIQKLRTEALQVQAKAAQAVQNQNAVQSGSSSAISPSPPPTQPSLEASPVLPIPLKRQLSTSKRPQSPSLLSQANSSPSRGSQPSSPLLVSFSAGHNNERRKTSSGSSSLSQHTGSSLQPGNFFEQTPRLPAHVKSSSSNASPVKLGKTGSISQLPLPDQKSGFPQRRTSVSSPRQRSSTVGSPDRDLVPELIPNHYKRRSQVFDISPSSSDNEDARHQALLRVQQRRQSSRRMSQISLLDGPVFRTLDVLVCEDHPVSRLVMDRLLDKLRCRTITVNNGSEAMRVAMSEIKFDIIMMEYKLPQINGADVARMIRDTRNPNSHTPIVAVTGYLKELQAPHHFDGLIEKPPTREKLEEVLGLLCQWKPAPEGWKPPAPQAIPPSNLRQESLPPENSPTTTTSSGFSGFPSVLSSSYRGSSREDSIGSSSLGDTESHYDSIPVIISRQATGEFQESDLERNFGGLGIHSPIEDATEEKGSQSLSVSAPVEHIPDPVKMDLSPEHKPRKVPSSEAIEAKRRSLEKGRQESAAESGDDEDEELGNITVRQKSPKRHEKRMSKLGTEMMRANSQGSVVSGEEANAMQSAIRSNPAGGLLGESVAEEDPIKSGHLTPPEIFPQHPGSHCESFAMDAAVSGNKYDPQATPRPHHHRNEPEPEPDPDPTPKAAVTPSPID